MGGRRWKNSEAQCGSGESRQGCLKNGRVLQTAAIPGQCVGNMEYVNSQQLGQQHGAPSTTKGDGLAGGLRPAWVSLSTCPGARTAGSGQVSPPTLVASLSAPGHGYGPNVPPSASDLSMCERRFPASMSPGEDRMLVSVLRRES